LTPQTVGIIIGNLEHDGAIRKTPHPVHGRVRQWNADPARREAAGQMPPPRHGPGTAGLAAGLGAKAELTVRRWLSKIATELQDN
jgi:hypothetical protein